MHRLHSDNMQRGHYHGQQYLQPLDSCLALRSGRLTISSLMKLDLPRAMLAYLSACETAKSDPRQPDQAVHLAASILFLSLSERCGDDVVNTLYSSFHLPPDEIDAMEI
jgi:hypothetical protein